VQTKPTEPLGEGSVRGDHQPAVTPRAQGLARKEGESGGPSELTRHPPVPVDLAARTNRLRRVLDDGDIARPRDGSEAFHGHHLAVEVDWQDGARPWRDGHLHSGGIDIEGARLDVHEHRSTA